MYSLLRPLLFKMDPEKAHDLTMTALGLISRSRITSRLLGVMAGSKVTGPEVNVMGIRFPNPVGLAAGLDKNAAAANALAALGFGWLELGTVTPKPQSGNPKPRLFRLTEHQAIINRMGFNSCGLTNFVASIQRISPEIVKGINIGKNASTPLAQSVDDYLTGLEVAYPHADYITINISSPNTAGLRDLQKDHALNNLLSRLNEQRQFLADQSGRHVPLVVKVSPDLDVGNVDSVANILRANQIEGLAATNTTVSRDLVRAHPFAPETGGLSGAPLREKSTEIIAAFHRNLQGEIPIIGIGGILSATDAIEKMQAGASLIQIYTGFVYHGPALIREICDSLN